MHKKQTVSIRECSDRIEELARRAHETGGTFYLTDQSTTLAAIVPVGSKATIVPPAALNASYSHLADALEDAE